MSEATYLLLAIVVMTAATFATRALPFFLLREQDNPVLLRLGRSLPPAVMLLLVIYCVKDVAWTQPPHGLPQLLAIALTAALHLWRGNALLSIAGGTGLYMWMQQSGMQLG